MMGPVLFFIFINDMALQLQTDKDIYADDTITDICEVSRRAVALLNWYG